MTKRVLKTVVKKSLGGAMTFRQWDKYAIGDVVIGKYMGTYVDQFKNTNYKIKVVDAQFEDQDEAETLIEKTLVLNKNGSLDKQMAEVSEGEYIRVEYNGKSVLTKGPFAGKEAHGCTVDIVEIEEDTDAEDGL